MPPDAALDVTTADGLATLTLDRPAVLNALDSAQRRGLAATFDRLEADPAVRAVILRGRGRAFCAGQDQRESAAMDAAAADDRIAQYSHLYDRMRHLSKPLLAQLHGHVAGAGLQLALLCDLRIAASDARLGMTEFNIGSAAILGSTLLRPVVGDARMRRLVMLSDFIAAEEALAWGLVHEVTAPEALVARVAALAASLAAKPPGGIRLTKAWWRRMSEAEFQAAVAEAHAAHAENFAAGALSAGARTFVAGRDS